MTGSTRRIVIPGGTGHLGRLLARSLADEGDDVVILGRRASANVPQGARYATWNARDQGAWSEEIDGADAVINLAGRSVDCRYNKHNLEEMLASRIDSTRAVGQAIEQAERPPRAWLQMSTATIYSHRFDAPNDEATGIIGGLENDAPAYWRYSVHIAESWERILAEANTPGTRRVALRTAMVMSAEPGGAFTVLKKLARSGLGGTIAGGKMYMSWIHGTDFVRSVRFLLEQEEISGAINLCAPSPLPQKEFMRALRKAVRMPIGLPATAWMIRMGAIPLRTDEELVLKSRRVVPGRLLKAGYQFEFEDWAEAAQDLVR